MHRGRGRGRGGSAASFDVDFPKRLFFVLLGQLKPNRIWARLDRDSGKASCSSGDDASRLEQLISKLKANEPDLNVGLLPPFSPGTEVLKLSSAPRFRLISSSTTPISTYSYEPLKKNIYVPGYASIYHRPDVPCELFPSQEVDDGSIDYNKATFANPFDPLLVTMSLVHDPVDLSEFDIVTDRNNLRKLFDTACGDDKLWRIDAESIQNTIFLKRYDPPKTDADKTSSSFGHAVEDLCTEQKTDPAHAFHALVRVEIQYEDEEIGDRGVVKLLVRCQLDAVLPSDEPAATSRQDELVKLAGKCAKASVDKVYTTREAKDPSFVEIRSAKEKNWIKQGGGVHLDTWFQSHIVGVSRMAMGIKDDSQTQLLAVEEFTPEEYCNEKLDGFPHDEMRRLVESLVLIRDFLKKRSQEGMNAWAFLADPDRNFIMCSKPTDQRSDAEWVLPQWFKA